MGNFFGALNKLKHETYKKINNEIQHLKRLILNFRT